MLRGAGWDIPFPVIIKDHYPIDADEEGKNAVNEPFENESAGKLYLLVISGSQWN